MRFVIVTGMSGAGKSTALKMLEDAEYFCVTFRSRWLKNLHSLPPTVLPEKSRKWQSESISEAARRSRTCRVFWSG